MTQANGPRYLSLIVPVYNEAEGIAHLAERLRPVIDKLERRYEVELVCIDDGSTDGTSAELERRFGDLPRFRMVRHSVNCGLGRARRSGFSPAP